MKPESNKNITQGQNARSLVSHFKNILDTLEQSLIIIDCSLQILYANKKALINAESILGASLHENANLWNHLSTDYHNEIYKQIQKALAGEVVITKHRQPTHKNHSFPLETSYTPLFDEDGSISCILLKEIEIYYKADKSQVLLHDTTYTATAPKENSNGMCRIQPNGSIVDINEEFAAKIGLSITELMGMNYFNLIEENEKEELWIQISRFSPEMPTLKHNQQVLNANQQPCWLKYTHHGIFDKYDKLIEIQIIVSDITQLKETKDNKILTLEEDSSQRSVDLYRKLIAASIDGITIIGIDGRITFASEKTVKIAGCGSDKEIVGTYPQDWFDESERERVVDRMKLVMQGHEICNSQYKMKRKNGELIVAEMNTTFLSAQDGSISGIISYVRDVTDRKKMEHELIEAKEKAEESDRLKTAFLTNISHEIRTPMNGIIGFSKLMADETITKETVIEYANIICTSCDQLLAIISDVIEISTIEAGQLSIKKDKLAVDVMFDEIKQLFERIASLNQIELKAQHDPVFKSILLHTDGHKVKQIFCNLLSNALKFTNNANVTYGYTVRNNHIEFFVKDDGIGISPEDHEIIFERFRKVDKGPKKIYGGTGLGLSISKSLVELLGGKIWVESQAGLGSQFYFTLPADGIHLAKSQTITATFHTFANCWLGKRILVAEDEEYNYVLICAMLRTTGISIIRARNGVEAFSLTLANPVDLILMDIKMPLMGGLNATESIRQFNKTIPIIAVSAYAFQLDQKKALAAGCTDFITKPVNQKILCEKINQYMKKTPHI